MEKNKNYIMVHVDCSCGDVYVNSFENIEDAQLKMQREFKELEREINKEYEIDCESYADAYNISDTECQLCCYGEHQTWGIYDIRKIIHIPHKNKSK